QDSENAPIKANDPIHNLEVTDQDCKDIQEKKHRGETIKNREKLKIIADKCFLRSSFKPTENPKSW
ncbi:MAG: hypothetical protein ACNA7Y_00005, partial [Gammaproteobacteria bacterium]